MLKTLGSQPVITLPHFFVLKACAKIRGTKVFVIFFEYIFLFNVLFLIPVSNYFTKVAYYLISDILSLTTFCLRYRPTDLAMLAIHVVGVWSKWTVNPLNFCGLNYLKYVISNVFGFSATCLVSFH